MVEVAVPGCHDGGRTPRERTMDVEKRYELLEVLAGEGGRSWRARQRSTGREVTVHLPAGGAAVVDEMQGLAHARQEIVEAGATEGTPFVVTKPPHLHWSEWVRGQREGPTADQKLGRVGMWKVPAGMAPARPPRAPSAAPPKAAAQPPPPPAPVAGEAEPAEQNPLVATRFFSSLPPKEKPPAPPKPAVLGATGAMPAGAMPASPKPSAPPKPADLGATGAMPAAPKPQSPPKPADFGATGAMTSAPKPQSPPKPADLGATGAMPTAPKPQSPPKKTED